MNEYAIYKGESLIFMGTIEECAKHLEVQPRTIKFYTTPTYQRRIEKRKSHRSYTIVVKIEDDENETK